MFKFCSVLGSLAISSVFVKEPLEINFISMTFYECFQLKYSVFIDIISETFNLRHLACNFSFKDKIHFY